jgi:hypothetical protein
MKQSSGISLKLFANDISNCVIPAIAPKHALDNVVTVLGKINAPLKGAIVNAYSPIEVILDSPQSKFMLFELKYELKLPCDASQENAQLLTLVISLGIFNVVNGSSCDIEIPLFIPLSTEPLMLK